MAFQAAEVPRATMASADQLAKRETKEISVNDDIMDLFFNLFHS